MAELPLDLLACPDCRGELEAVQDCLMCKACRKSFPIKDGIPDFV